MGVTDEELQSWVEKVSLASFGRPFRHQAAFNGRLRSTGGRYLLRSHRIEISRKYYETYGAEETEKIIKHELCHYHLHLEKRGYRHRDADFRRLLAEVGGTRYCRALPGAKRTLPVRWLLQCAVCGMQYPRKRKIDPRRYRCGECRGRLRLIPLESP